MNDTAQKTDVLIISAGVGAGHNQAAAALAEGLRISAPQLAVRKIDALDFTSRWFRAYYAGGFAVAMTRLPWAYGLGFWLTNRPHGPRRGLVERMRLAGEVRSTARLAEFVEQVQPRLIVNTHFLAPPMVDRLVRKGRIACRQMVVATDIDAHRWWYSRGVDQWFVPAEHSAEQVHRWGIDRERITASGIPIHPKWMAQLDRHTILSQWGLPGDKNIVLLTGGTQFTCGPIVKLARGILDQCPSAAVVVLAGRNKQLLQDLTALPDIGKRLFPQGFTDRAHELAEVCSLMVTKAGGITTAECLAKGVPMVLLKPVPGQEGLNARYFAREGAAVITRTPGQVVDAVAELLSNKAKLGMMSSNARRLYKPATATIVQAIVQQLAQPRA